MRLLGAPCLLCPWATVLPLVGGITSGAKGIAAPVRSRRVAAKQPHQHKKGKGSPYSITERRVPELIPVLGSQPADDVSH